MSSSSSSSDWSRLVRFIPTDGCASSAIGEPVDPTLDIGLATYSSTPVPVTLFSGSSILSPGTRTSTTTHIKQLLSPLSQNEVGTIRCIGLNYKLHAKETGLDLPTVPILFLKPATSLTGPWPAEVVVPKFTQASESADYESELGVVIGKDCKNVSEEEALDYVLGYTATNDISSRASQFEQSQWCFSKGFDTACPIGPVLVSTRSIKDPSKLVMKGIKNGKTLQSSGLDDLVFNVPKLVSFLSQGTTLKAGTLILTGTPHGIGFFYKPPEVFKDGDEFRVEIDGGIGTLINKITFEK